MEALQSATIMRKGFGDRLVKVFFSIDLFLCDGLLFIGFHVCFTCVFIVQPVVCLCVFFSLSKLLCVCCVFSLLNPFVCFCVFCVVFLYQTLCVFSLFNP